MIQKNPFLKYLIKDEKKDIFHSSAYAKTQNGAAMGAASTESFEARVKVNQNRQMVRGYRDSKVMTGVVKNAPRAKTYTPPEQGGGIGGARGISSRGASGVSGRSGLSGGTGVSGARRMMTPKRPGISFK